MVGDSVGQIYIGYLILGLNESLERLWGDRINTAYCYVEKLDTMVRSFEAIAFLTLVAIGVKMLFFHGFVPFCPLDRGH